jgi:hypothetical protein
VQQGSLLHSLVPWGEGQVFWLDEVVAGGAEPDAVRGAVVGRRGPLDASDGEDRVGRKQELLCVRAQMCIERVKGERKLQRDQGRRVRGRQGGREGGKLLKPTLW